MAEKEKQYIKADDLYKISWAEDPQWSPDGGRVAFVRQQMDKGSNSYKRTIWCWEEGWKEPRQFTTGGKQDFSPRFDPQGERLAFLSTRGGKPQVYLMRTDGGEAKALTSLPNGVTGFRWSPDGKFMALSSALNRDERRLENRGQFPPPPPKDALEGKVRELEKEETEKKRVEPRIYEGLPFKQGTGFVSDRYNHVYLLEVDAEEAKPQRLTDGDKDFALPQWSPNGRYLWSSSTRRPTHDRFAKADLVRITVKDGVVKRMPRPGHFGGQPKPSPDGKWVAAMMVLDKSSYGHISRLAVFRPDGSGWRDLNLAFDRSVGAARYQSQFFWAADSKGLYAVIDSEGTGQIYYISLDSGEFTRLVGGKQLIQDLAVNPKGGFAYIASTPARPTDLYTAEADGRGARRRSDFNKKFLESVLVAKTEEIKYKAPDGQRIQGWIVKPPDFDPKKKWPLALNIHGGPHVMWSPSAPSMWIEWQLHAARGYVVFYCNPRGSDGYGDAFRSAIYDNWGEEEMPDILSGVDVVVAKGYVDETRMAVTGGSYGGFMTSWIVGHDQRFACAVSQRGVYQLMSFYGTTDIPILIENEFGVKAFDDPEKMWKYSPFAYVRKIRTPLMILHSDNDFRVPVSDAEQLFTALKRLGRKVQFVRYPREGHELSRSGEPKLRVDRLERMTGWFDKYCKPRKV